MQPVLYIVCDIEGLVYINGRLAGETGPEKPLFAPAAPGGCTYVEYKPLHDGYLSMARRLAVDMGRLEIGEGLYALAWPSGVVEVEILPQKARAEIARSELDLPADDLPPDDVRNGLLTLCVGPCACGGRYAAAFDETGQRILEARGDETYFSQTGDMRLFRRENDVVGHARLLTYQTTDEGVTLVNNENMWEPGAPRWPDSPEKTALACAEAAILGLWDETNGYLLPDKQEECRILLEDCARFDCAFPMRFPLPDGRSAIALCRATGERTGEVRPLYYHAVPGGGVQGPWRIDRLELDPCRLNTE